MYNKTFIEKYKPKKFNDFFENQNYINFFKMLIENDGLSLLIYGDTESGKTTLLSIILNEYYNFKIDEKNILYINNLQEKGINFYRNEINIFCKNINKIKKTIIIDDIDLINEKKQHIFRHFIDNFSNKINFIFSCTKIQNIIECLQTRLFIFKIPKINKKNIKNIFNKIKNSENLQITKEAETYLLNNSNCSINQIINYSEKIKLIDIHITIKNIKYICTNFCFSTFQKYTNSWYIKKDFKKSIELILKIYNKGYSIIDIYEYYFFFIKKTKIINDLHKFKVIKLLSKYITIFYTLYEKKNELYFLTNDLIHLFE